MSVGNPAAKRQLPLGSPVKNWCNVECGGVYRGYAECGGGYWEHAECGGEYREYAECGGGYH